MKTKEQLEQEYINSYTGSEGIFIIVVLLCALACIVIGFII